MMDIIKVTNLGIYFKVGKKQRGSLRETVAKVLGNNHEKPQFFWALRNVSFSVAKGETLGVIGRNGSGKSTLLRVIGGIYPPSEGQIEVKGTVSTLLSTTAGFQPELSGIENIYLNGILIGLKKEEIDRLLESIVTFSELGDFINRPVKTYSSGMYARLGFSIAVNIQRDILLIDEVLGAGDAKFKEKSQQKMTELLTGGETIILVSHNMDAIRKFANKVILLDKGRVTAQGAPEEIISKYLSL
jgi:ABC-type polysaccharide/polyol phosphate transport system ATPase subunit